MSVPSVPSLPLTDHADAAPDQARTSPGARPGPSTGLLVVAFLTTRLLCLVALTAGGHRAAGGGGVASSLFSGAWHWDAHWYAGIALQGYELTLGAGSNVAYFPASPLLLRLVGGLVGHPIPAGMLLSVAESAIAIALSVRVMSRAIDAAAARRGALLLMVWPTSVFLVLPYADALLLLAAVTAFSLAQRGHALPAAAAGAVGALTRSTGVLLALPIALLLRNRTNLTRGPTAQRGRFKSRAWLASLVLAGTAAYGAALFFRFREPLGFAAAEAAGWHRVALPPPLPVAFTLGRLLAAPWFFARGRPDLPFTDLLDLGAIALVAWALWTSRRRVPPAYLVWPAVGLLWPLLTGTTSVARYTLALFPAFGLFAGRLSPRRWQILVSGSVVALTVASFTFGAGGWIG